MSTGAGAGGGGDDDDNAAKKGVVGELVWGGLKDERTSERTPLMMMIPTREEHCRPLSFTYLKARVPRVILKVYNIHYTHTHTYTRTHPQTEETAHKVSADG